MKSLYRPSLLLAALAAMCLLASAATANVWINEDFDGTIAAPFTQGDGVPDGTNDGTIDFYDVDGAPSTNTSTLMTMDGTVVTTKAFNGTACYELGPGETFACADGYDGQTHGDYIYFQFALNVDPIPPAGDVFRWEYSASYGPDPGSLTDYRIFLEGVSDGTTVAISGGEDLTLNETVQVTSLSGPNQWTYLTVQLANNALPQHDPRDPNQTAPDGRNTGVYFYADNTVEVGSVLGIGDVEKDGNGWSFTVDAGTTASVYLDDFYWDGAMETEDEANQDLQRFDKVADNQASAEQWELYQ